MSSKQKHDNHPHRNWMDREHRNISSLSDSSEKATSSTASITSPSASSIPYHKTSATIVTAEESSATNSSTSCKDGSSSSSDAALSNKRSSNANDSSESFMQEQKRRKKGDTKSFLSEDKNKSTESSSESSDTSEKDGSSSSSSMLNEEGSSEPVTQKHERAKSKNKSTESSSASSDTSEKDDSSFSSMLLYKDGKTNLSIKRYVCFRTNQKDQTTSSPDTSEQDAQDVLVSKNHGKELVEREQNTSACLMSTHDGTVSKLSQSTDTNVQDNTRKTKKSGNGALGIHSVSFSSASLHANSRKGNSKKGTRLAKEYSHQGSALSSDTSDPDSASTSYSSSSVKCVKTIVGRAMHDYLSSFSATAGVVGEGVAPKNINVTKRNAECFSRSNSNNDTSIANDTSRRLLSAASIPHQKASVAGIVTTCEDGSSSSSNNALTNRNKASINQGKRSSNADDSSAPHIHEHKRRKKLEINSFLSKDKRTESGSSHTQKHEDTRKVDIDSFIPESKNKSTESSSESSDTSEKDDSSSSSLINKDDSSELFIHKHRHRKKGDTQSFLSEDKNKNTESSSESSDTSEKDGSSSSSSLISKDDSSDSYTQKLKRTRKVGIHSFLPESKNKITESSLASSDTSEKDYAHSSSMLLYKDGKTNSNIETYLSLRVNQKDQTTSSPDTSEQDAQVGSSKLPKNQGKKLAEREQNTSACLMSTHDGTVSTLSQSIYSRSLDNDTNVQDNTRKTKKSGKGALGNSRKGNSKKGTRLAKEYSHQGSALSSDTSDPDSASSSSSSSSAKLIKKIVGKAMHDYLSSFSATAGVVGEGVAPKNINVEVDREEDKKNESLLRSNSSASSSSSESPERCVAKESNNDAATADNEETIAGVTVGRGAMLAYDESSNTLETIAVSTEVNSNIAHKKGTPVPSFYPSVPSNVFDPESLHSKIDECIYHDHSQVTPEAALTHMQNNSVRQRIFTKEPSFPQKLHQILSNPEYKKLIAWLPHGRAWRIEDQKKFQENILPQHFRHAKLASFMRQVRNWGFKRIPDGPDQNGYYNECFLRGLPHVSIKMRRQPTGRKEERLHSIFSKIRLTPDFYQISKEYPLPDENGNDPFSSELPHSPYFSPDGINSRKVPQHSNAASASSTFSTGIFPGQQVVFGGGKGTGLSTSPINKSSQFLHQGRTQQYNCENISEADNDQMVIGYTTLGNMPGKQAQPSTNRGHDSALMSGISLASPQRTQQTVIKNSCADDQPRK